MKRVVIVGGGFGGVSAARGLRGLDIDVTLVDRANHHVFQPLLYQVATAALSPGDISSPIRWLLRRQREVRVLQADAVGIDVEHRQVRLDREPGSVPYDFLVVAAGARHAYFDHPEWEAFAPGLKTIEDALEVRNRFLSAFERAELTQDPEERAAWMTFVLVGGGPTGVELAGVMPVIARRALRKDFRAIDTRDTRVILIEAGPRILPAFPETLSARAHRDLERLGVEVRTGGTVTHIDAGGVRIGDESITARTVFWGAGNVASGLGGDLGGPQDRAGRVLVEPDLSVPGRPEVFVIGDQAALRQDGEWIPWVAPAALQQGRHAAKTIRRRIRGKRSRPFRYVNKGNLATIGRNKAIADFGWLRVSGRAAWWLWLFVHILYLAGFRSRASVLVEWSYAYFTYQRGVRLITSDRPPR